MSGIKFLVTVLFVQGSILPYRTMETASHQLSNLYHWAQKTLKAAIWKWAVDRDEQRESKEADCPRFESSAFEAALHPVDRENPLVPTADRPEPC